MTVSIAGRCAVALLHYPVRDKNGQIVTTSVTNLDIHDIARSAKTFGLSSYFIVNPAPGQHDLVNRLLLHWLEGWGASYNSKRKDALEAVRLAWDLAEVQATMAAEFGEPPLLVMTAARRRGEVTKCVELLRGLEHTTRPVLLVFGTGWGLADELLDQADVVLEPIAGCSSYNHLSVRSAVAIYLDRLFGQH